MPSPVVCGDCGLGQSEVEHGLDGADDLGGGQAVAGQAGDGHGADGLSPVGQVVPDDAGQGHVAELLRGRDPPVPVDRHVRDLGRELVALYRGDMGDEQGCADASGADRCGQGVNVAAGVSDVLRVLRDVFDGQLDDLRGVIGHWVCSCSLVGPRYFGGPST